MNNISIHIDSLGPIRNADIDIRPLMIFTGESGLGKSYLACLANYTYALLSKGNGRLMDYFSEVDFSTLLDGKKSGDVIFSITTSDLFNWINRDAIHYIGYMIGNPTIEGKVNISWPFSENKIDFKYHESLTGLDNNEKTIYRFSSDNFNFNSEERAVSASILTTLIQAEFIKSIDYTPLKFISNYILPPSRGALMEIQEIPTFRSGMFYEFFKLKSDIARPIESPREQDAILTNLLSRINDGTISLTNDNLTYTTHSGHQMPLSAAASSIKELAALALLLPKYNLDDMTLLFEEPEAHLHPSRQQSLADLIGYIVSKGCHLRITTHSDYFIKRINALIKLYPVISRLQSQDSNKLLDKHGIIKESLIDAEKVIAYNLSRNENGYTNVSQLKTDAEEGVPFDSFHKVITRYFDLLSDLNDIGNNTNDEE